MSTLPWSPAPSDPDPPEVSCDLDTISASTVRHLVRELLTGHSGLIIDDAALVVDELVSNAHRHGEGPRVCRLSLVSQGGCLRVEVDDTSPAHPRIRPPDESGGRGLILVDRLSSAWGVTRHPRHKTVWAELALDRPGSSGHAPHLATSQDWRTPH
jgi:anti-sigma regulatory factor (Ser/Thr protein kinase)